MTGEEYNSLRIGDRVVWHDPIIPRDYTGTVFSHTGYDTPVIQFDIETPGRMSNIPGDLTARYRTLTPVELGAYERLRPPLPTLGERVNTLWDGALTP